jgi:hypothetical protein
VTSPDAVFTDPSTGRSDPTWHSDGSEDHLACRVDHFSLVFWQVHNSDGDPYFPKASFSLVFCSLVRDFVRSWPFWRRVFTAMRERTMKRFTHNLNAYQPIKHSSVFVATR